MQLTEDYISFRDFSIICKEEGLECNDIAYLDYLKIHSPSHYRYLAGLAVYLQEGRKCEETAKQEISR